MNCFHPSPSLHRCRCSRLLPHPRCSPFLSSPRLRLLPSVPLPRRSPCFRPSNSSHPELRLIPRAYSTLFPVAKASTVRGPILAPRPRPLIKRSSEMASSMTHTPKRKAGAASVISRGHAKYPPVHIFPKDLLQGHPAVQR